MHPLRRHPGRAAALPVLVVAGVLAAAVCAGGQDRPPAGPDAGDFLRRIQGRTFPSVFQAWSAAEGVADASPLDTMARHDLVFHGPGGFGLRWDRRAPRSAAYVNGLFMECTRTRSPDDWRRIAHALAWAESHLREPRINGFETWYHTSRRDLPLMRATTTLVLTHSDGYWLFSDPNDLPAADHRHDWYPFWNRSLGKPTGALARRDDGAAEREFERGTVLYNPLGNRPVTVAFDGPRTSLATGKTARTHTVGAPDGDVFLKPAAWP